MEIICCRSSNFTSSIQEQFRLQLSWFSMSHFVTATQRFVSLRVLCKLTRESDRQMHEVEGEEEGKGMGGETAATLH